MPSYKLTYFNARGRAELPRLLFAAAKQAYTDERIEQKDWPALKARVKLGGLPILEEDGKMTCQSMAIVRHLARTFGLYGKTNEEMKVVDEVLECLTDVRLSFYDAFFSKEKETAMKKAIEKAGPNLCRVEELYQKYGKGSGFLVGGKLSVADLAIYDLMELAGAMLPEEEKKKIPGVMGNKKAVESVRSVKEWLDKRPKSEF